MKKPGAFSLYYTFLLILLYIPIAVLFLYSVNDGIAFTFPMQGLTSHWYEDMLGNAELITALKNSALVALVSSLMATTLGTMAAIAVIRFSFRGKSLLIAVALLPLLLPFLILGVALLILFAALDISRSLTTVAIAHSVVSLPYTLLILMARLVGFDPHLEEAAQDLGAGYFYTLRRVILPLIAPAIVAAWLVAFTVSFDEFVLASFLNGGQATLPVYIFGQLRFANRFPQVIALAMLVMLMSITFFVISDWLQRLGTSTPPIEDTYERS
jgi:spermidine/putrescine transport system permease protein